MKQGYKCDHCSEFSEDEAEIKEHEVRCSFNNSNKNCVACLHYNEGYPFPCPSCEMGVEGFCDKLEEDKTDCERFEAAYPD